MRVGLITNYLAPYRIPLYELLAQRCELEVLCYGGDARYIPPWQASLEDQLEAAPVTARPLAGGGEALRAARDHDIVIAPFAGGSIMPLAYAGARRYRKRFILWASVWAQPRTPGHVLALPAIRHIYRRADAVIAYGEHVRAFVANIRGTGDDVFVAPQAVEAELFGRQVAPHETEAFRRQHGLPDGPLVLYVGRLSAEKGIEVLRAAWPLVQDRDATLVAIGDGPLAQTLKTLPRTKLIGPVPREDLPIAYAAARLALLPSVPTRRFLEPWGMVCNEALHQGCPVVASTAVGAVAGGLIRHEQTGLVVPAKEPRELAAAIECLLNDGALQQRLGSAGRSAVASFNYEAMLKAFDLALRAAYAE